MNFTDFCRYMDKLRKLDDCKSELYKFGIDLSNFKCDMTMEYIELLSKAVQIPDNCDIISYYIYETDWGKKGKDCIEDENCIKYSITNYNELWNYILDIKKN